jgi:hypothetical protein
VANLCDRMLIAVYFAFSMIVVAFLMGLYKLWRVHRSMVARDGVMTNRMIEVTRAHQEASEVDSEADGPPEQGVLWDE